MVNAIFLFELQNQFRRLSTYVYFALFLALGFLVAIAAAGAFASVDLGMGTGGKVVANSPYMLFAFISGLSFYGLLVIATVMGHSACQDFLHNSYPLLFTTPIAKTQYLCGRYLSSTVVLLFIFSSIGIGALIGSWMPFLDEQLVGTNQLSAYVRPYLLSVIPNTLFIGVFFFGLGALARKMMPVYVTAVLIFVGYLIAATLAMDLESKLLAGIVDPFGSFAFEYVTQYWTVADKNLMAVPAGELLLVNRLIWLAAGAAFFCFTLTRFRFAQGGEDTKRLAGSLTDQLVRTDLMLPRAGVQSRNPFFLLPGLTWREFRQTVSSLGFLLIVAAGVTFIFVGSQMLETIYGTTVYPVTATVVELARDMFGLFLLIIITVYSGQMVWREREANMDQLCDVLPTPTWLPYVAKLLALFLVQILLLGVVMLSGVVIQAAQAYYKFELGLYVRDLFGLQLVDLCLYSVLAFLVQIVVNHKYLGHFVMVCYYLASAFGPNFGFEHRLYRYASDPGYTYSDMNRFGPFIGPIVWFDLYWAMFAVLLAVAGNLMWVRGLETGIRHRLLLARQRFSPAQRGVVAFALIACMAVGGFIFYNANVLNEYNTRYDNELRQVEYETNYKQRMDVLQPRIEAVQVNVDIYPDQRTLRARGTFRVANKSNEPISTVFLNLLRETHVNRLAIGSTSESDEIDERHGIHVFQLREPMLPGETLPLNFDLEYAPRGFKNGRVGTRIVQNGTFVNHGYLPSLGYRAGRELSDDNARRKRGLEPKERMASIDDETARRNNYISLDADWIEFEATLSTSLDQIAVAPGTLQREWTEDGRRYFHYKADGPILNFYSFLSARYEVLRDQWNDVAIEIYYHQGHEYNLPSMVKAIKASLDYYTANFSPYQHKQLRILEFPRYETFAQSFPNTVPYSEGIGFIARVDPHDEQDIDYPVYVTAHEVAHQWWAHQVIGGNVQGATMLSETLAQYSALMVMKNMFGPGKMKRFLSYELDLYLSGRGSERKKELPLALVENQPYIHYHKGSLVMYALQDYLGEDTVNRALASFISETGFQGPPYTTSRELIEHFRKVTPDQLSYVIDDLFETITLFDNRAVKATYEAQDDGKYQVRLSVATKKLRADELGKETQIVIEDLIDVGVMDEKGEYLYLDKHAIGGAESEILIDVDRRPQKAGIDPLNILVDRKPGDNVVDVKPDATG